MAPPTSPSRPVWIVTAAAAVVLVVGLVLQSVLTPPKSAERQIGEQLYTDCGVTTVSSNARAARRWPEASKSEVIVCQASENDPYPNEILDYARFASAGALSAALKAAPPDHTHCTIGSAVVIETEFF